MLFVNIYKLSKFTLDPTEGSKERRRTKNHRLLIQRECRQQARRLYWKDLLEIERRTITSLAWYIQMQLIRTNCIPSYLTFAQMQKLPAFQLDIRRQASSVYNDMYRDRRSSQFILCDTGHADLDGRVGYVDWFDDNLVKYRVLVCRKGFSDYENTFPMTLKPENMKSVITANKKYYNKEAKQDTAVVGIRHFCENTSNHLLEATVRHDAFSYVCKIHERPEIVSNDAYSTMIKYLQDQEDKEQESEANIASQREEYTRCMDEFFLSHKPVDVRPRKIIRTKPKGKSEDPVVKNSSGWAEKFEHIRSSIMANKDGEGEHLFTFPFSTKDNSLMSCAEGLVELNEHRVGGELHDVALVNSMKMKPTFITTASVKSLSPGFSIDEDILNFCLKW